VKASSDKPRTHAGQRDWLLSPVMILLFLACGFLLGFLAHQMISSSSVQVPVPSSPATTPQAAQTATDLVLLQLIERAKDNSENANRTIAIIGVMGTLLCLALGLRIWQVGEHAMNLLNQQFVDFRAHKIEPVIENSRKELHDLSNEGTMIILGASDLLLNDLFQEFQKRYKKTLEQQGVIGDALDSRLRDEEESFRTSREITQYLIASLSRDEEIVIDQCHKLSALARRKDFDTKADSVLTHLARLIQIWGPGTVARTEIIRLYDQIEGLKRSTK
jgi:hypothetical protein